MNGGTFILNNVSYNGYTTFLGRLQGFFQINLHAFSDRPILACRLQIHHVGVQSLSGVQLCRAALLGHDAARQHHHLIRTGHGAHPVGDDEDGFVFYEPG